MNTARKPLHLTGVIPPMITPLTADGEVDTAGVARMARFLLDGGVHGIFVLGSSGEGPWLTPAQQQAVIAHTVQAVGGRVPVLAGALEPSTARTVTAVQQAAAAGADAVVVTSPYYFAADARVQAYHVEKVAAASPVPVVLYNIPTATHNPIAPATVARLLHLDNLVAMKDSAGDWDAFQQLLALRPQKPGFTLFQGAEVQAAQALLAGADGIVPGLGNVVPATFVRLYQAATAGDSATALALQEQITALWKLHGHGFWLACLKYAASLRGAMGATTAARATELSADARHAIRQLFDAYAGLPV